MVKAIRIHETGGPEVMRLEDIEIGEPGPGEVLVRNRAIGVNFIDTYFRTGHYAAPSLPFTPGNEAAGEVAKVGKGVKGVKEGDRVGYVSHLGCYAQERIVMADRLIHLPKRISYETAAAMMLKGFTARYLLRRTFKVGKGDRVLIQAAAGATGLILTQWAKSLGATVIGTAGSPEKAEAAKKAGAKHVILYREEDFVARVKEITKGKLCDVVYDGVGKATFPASLDCLKPLGTFVSFGSASGAIEAFALSELTKRGSLYACRPTLATYTDSHKDLMNTARDLLHVVETGDVKIAIHQTAPLEEAVRVHQELEGRATSGANVLIS